MADVLLEAVIALHDCHDLLAQDPSLAQSLALFRGSSAAFSACLETCRENCTEPASAACNVLSALFYSTVAKEDVEKREPLQFDETAMLLRDMDSFIRRVTADVRDLLASTQTTMRACGFSDRGVPQDTTAVEMNSASLFAGMTVASAILSQTKVAVHHLCSEATKHFNVRLVASVEVEKRLAFLLPSVACLSSDDQQRLASNIASELQCRLERQWVGQVVSASRARLAGHSAADVVQHAVDEFERSWLRGWYKRLEVLQDEFLQLSESLKASVRQVAHCFPCISPEEALLIDALTRRAEESARNSHQTAPPPMTFDRLLAVEFRHRALGATGGASVRSASDRSRVSATVRQRDSLLRPRLQLGRVLNACTPPPLLHVLELPLPPHSGSNKGRITP